MSAPAVLDIRKTNGVAGQIQYTASVQYEGEDKMDIAFVGSTFGGPVLMITPNDPRGTFVTDAGRFGAFGPDWVRRFFG